MMKNFSIDNNNNNNQKKKNGQQNHWKINQTYMHCYYYGIVADSGVCVCVKKNKGHYIPLLHLAIVIDCGL